MKISVIQVIGRGVRIGHQFFFLSVSAPYPELYPSKASVHLDTCI